MNAPLIESYRAADHSGQLTDHTVGALLALRAAEHPEREALVGTRHGSGTPDRLTYAQLFDEASRTAAALSALAARGSFVAVWAPNVIEWPILQYGAALAGMVLVAVNPVLRDAELLYVLKHSGAALLLHADVAGDYQMAEAAERVCAELPSLQRISLSETARWMTRAGENLPAAGCAPGPDDVAMLQYTSGTTGLPKGVLLKHRSLVNVAKLTMEAVGVADAAVCLNPLPMFHTAGCVIGTLGPLWVGGRAVLVQRFTAPAVLDQLSAESVQVLFHVPTVLAALIDCQRGRAEAAPRLAIIMGGAAQVSPALIADAEATFGARVFNLFGQTELAPVLSVTRPDDQPDDLRYTVGRPLPQVDCKISDPGTGRVVALGEVGEICARGYQQFVGYLHDERATDKAHDADGFVRTGDLGSMDERGYLRVAGRLKELIIRGGENVSPVDVEEALRDHPAVDGVAVVGLPDERLGEIVAAVLIVNGSDPELRESLLEHSRNRLAPFKIPARWFVADSFPLTPTGKVQRFALRESISCNEFTEL